MQTDHWSCSPGRIPPRPFRSCHDFLSRTVQHDILWPMRRDIKIIDRQVTEHPMNQDDGFSSPFVELLNVNRFAVYRYDWHSSI
jgi:hypothetical protein